MRDVHALPKANLHLHLTGAMRPQTMRDLASQHGMPAPDMDGAPTAARFQSCYNAARSVIRTPANIERIMREAAADNAADGATWIEVQVDPTAYTNRFGSPEHTIETVLDAAEAATLTTGVGIGVIIASSWTRSAEHALELAVLAGRYAVSGVVGFGLSNDERRGHVPDFVLACHTALNAGLRVVPHSGAVVPPSHIADCVTLLGASRIGHGLTAAHDEQVMTLLAEKDVVLEVCPASYTGFGLIATLKDLPLRRFRDAGVPVALGSDDPLIFGASLADQYYIARNHLHMTDQDLATMAINSVTGSCAPAYMKNAMLRGIDQWATRKLGSCSDIDYR